MGLSVSQLTTLRDAAYSALQTCLQGKDVMFEGNRITIDDSDRLIKLIENLDRKIDAASGSGMMKRNVGIIRRS